MWTRDLAEQCRGDGRVFVAVNPGSLLATKMVKDGFGMPGKDIRVGSQILERAALDQTFAEASGQYYDNDARRFADPHADGMSSAKTAALMEAMDALLAGLISTD